MPVAEQVMKSWTTGGELSAGVFVTFFVSSGGQPQGSVSGPLVLKNQRSFIWQSKCWKCLCKNSKPKYIKSRWMQNLYLFTATSANEKLPHFLFWVTKFKFTNRLFLCVAMTFISVLLSNSSLKLNNNYKQVNIGLHTNATFLNQLVFIIIIQ